MSTINKKEIEKFSKIADEWWDIDGKFKPLHKFNPLRIKYIKEKIMLLNKDRKNVRTFASYEVNDELFSDRNVFPKGCIVRMEKINEK